MFSGFDFPLSQPIDKLNIFIFSWQRLQDGHGVRAVSQRLRAPGRLRLGVEREPGRTGRSNVGR